MDQDTFPINAYRFDLKDTKWLEYLRSNGYVVIKNVATKKEIEASAFLLKRDLSTLKLPTTGLIAKLAQSEGAWAIRGVRKLKDVFSMIWETDDLIVSMDSIIAWKLWKGYNSSSYTDAYPIQPKTEGLHLDQNPFSKPSLDCIQGMMPLLSVTKETGGLTVVPFSHSDENKVEFKARYPGMKNIGDWCPISEGDPMYNDAILLLAEPGDLILWDSRTVHGGMIGSGEKDSCSSSNNDIKYFNSDSNMAGCNKQNQTFNGIKSMDNSKEIPLVRLSVCVSMTPRSKANDAILKARKDGFDQGLSFNHCPHEAGTSSGTIKDTLPANCPRTVLTKYQSSLM